MAIAGNFLKEPDFSNLHLYDTYYFPTDGGFAVEYGNRRVKVLPLPGVDTAYLMKYIRLPRIDVGHNIFDAAVKPHGVLKEREEWDVADARKEILQWLLQGLLDST